MSNNNNSSYAVERSIKLTPAQERLLEFFENKIDLPDRIESFRWAFETIIFQSEADLGFKQRNYLIPLNDLIKILEGIKAGF